MIEDLIEKINESKTKELFKDVYALYSQGQYRATIVMLWTVTVCDLVYKLQYLKDLYNDSTAIDILNKITDKQKRNPKNPEWEIFLIKELNERTQLITDIEKENLEYLQKQRNLCAHPIITQDNILFKPTKELTRSLIRIVLESILLKSPLLSKEYKDMILEDFESKKESFELWDENADRYFENRYLKHLNINQILNLFRLLWKVVFITKDERAINNLEINANLLNYLFSKYTNECINFMEESIDYYTYDNSEKEISRQFEWFIIKYSGLYEILSEQTKSIFKAEQRNFARKIPLYFTTDYSLKEYMEKLTTKFKEREEEISGTEMFIPLIQLQSQAANQDEIDSYHDLCIDWYTDSRTFNEADLMFGLTIRHRYKTFDLEKFHKFIRQSSRNSQTYYRKRANDDHKLIIKKFLELGGEYEAVKETPFEDLYIELGGAPF